MQVSCHNGSNICKRETTGYLNELFSSHVSGNKVRFFKTRRQDKATSRNGRIKPESTVCNGA